MLVHIGGVGIAPLLLQVGPNPNGLTPDQRTQIVLAALNNKANAATGTLALLVPYAFFAMTVLIFWLLLRQKQAGMKARGEFNKQLLDKFGSGQEFSDFVASNAGQQFLAALRSQSQEANNRILATMRVGIVLAALGLGFLGLTLSRHLFLVPAVLCLAMGLGFLLSALVSHHFSRRWEEGQNSAQGNIPLS